MEMVAELVGRILAGEIDFTHLEKTTWEESLKAGRETLRRLFEALDDALLDNRPEGLEVVCRKPRKILTVMGEIHFRRRYYRDGEGRHRFLLDELLAIEPKSHLSPRVKEAVAIASSHFPYRSAEEIASLLMPDVITHTTFMNKARDLGKEYFREQEEGARALFEWGELPEGEGREADILYSELDGTPINLQKEAKRKGEMKLAITHEGWSERGDGQYELKGKRIHMGMGKSEDFAHTHVYDIARRWDMGNVSRFIVGGDGGPLAKKGADLAPRSLFQLDRFHLKRAFKRALGGEGELEGKLYDLAVSGSLDQVLKALEEMAKEASPERQREIGSLISYLKANREGLIDYRERLPEKDEEARGLGAIEGNIDKNAANRFKKRGMRFTVDGANSLAKVIELRQNDLLSSRITERRGERRAGELRQAVVSAASLINRRLTDDPEDWLSVHMPALYGPHPDEPWVKVLRGISHIAEAV